MNNVQPAKDVIWKCLKRICYSRLVMANAPSLIVTYHGLMGSLTLRKQQRNGKQVYQLGAATIQLDKNLIYVAPKGEGEWKAHLPYFFSSCESIYVERCIFVVFFQCSTLLMFRNLRQAASMDELLKLAKATKKWCSPFSRWCFPGGLRKGFGWWLCPKPVELGSFISWFLGKLWDSIDPAVVPERGW